MAKRGKKGPSAGGAKGKKSAAKAPPAATESKGGTLFYWILGGVALAGVAALLFAGSGGSGAPENLPVSVAEMDAEASGSAGVSYGPADALVTVIEFEDFQCPACRQFNALTGKLLRQQYATGDDAILRWVTYDMPVLGQASWPPALASRCAEDQGRFWEMHDLLYARTEDWIRASNPNTVFVDFAEELGLDRTDFTTCLSERTHLEAIASSRNYGEALGVSGTPTLYVNGRRINLTRDGSFQALERLILDAAETAAGEAARPAADG